MQNTRSKPLHLPPAIDEMVRRLVDGLDPEQIILFGSYARGTAGPDSDADLLVVMEVTGRKRPKAVEMYGELAGVALPKDLILVTPDELEQQRDDPGYVVYSALREGVVLYDRAGPPTKPKSVGREGRT